MFLAGLEECGKTTLMYYLMFGKILPKPQPTKGFNNEVITFNKWQSYEFWDPGGSIGSRSLWKRYYSRIHFDYLVYVISGVKWLSDKKKDTVLNEDRMELHALLNEMELRKTKFIVMINVPQKFMDALTDNIVQEIEEELELSNFPMVKLVSKIEDLKTELGVESDPVKSMGCFC